MIVIVKGCGTNLASVRFALERIGKQSLLTNNINDIKKASHVILPGVNTAKLAMQRLNQLKLIEVIKGLKQPVLGICSGMQILYEYSHENHVACLGIVKGEIKNLATSEDLPIPHMGWNILEKQVESSLLKNILDNSYVYYVHSYAATTHENAIATTTYGQKFPAIIQHNNFYGVQFHPEKSGHVGEIILNNFLELR